ncbi:MAG TPA: phosphate ABC transporter permease PstA [Jatrophihabitantaceae bacterium]|jgi:phosphate transport system permease protein|nr:phosphate ABC transporter permease PstA [Jatrophihabitantaceae bacterium]
MTASTLQPQVSAPPRTLADASAGRSRRLKNHLATVLITLSFLIALVPLVWLLWTVVSKGLYAITRNGWFTHSQRNLTFTDPGGGAYHAILGTFGQVGLCAVIAVPISLLVAIYLVEYGRGRLARATTFVVDVLTGLPSIVAAVFVYAVFIGTLGGHRAGWLVSMALVLLMIPVVVRASEQMLRLVPDELREASYALGVPRWRTILRVVLPTAFTGIVTGVVLGIARVAGETAPLLVLVGYSPSINGDLFHGPQAALPGMINAERVNLTSGGTYVLGTDGKPHLVHNFAVDRVWGAALTLVLIVMFLNLVARLVGRLRKTG